MTNDGQIMLQNAIYA